MLFEGNLITLVYFLLRDLRASVVSKNFKS
jgi:hypothetical protein